MSNSNFNKSATALLTIVRKEVVRFFRIWPQTILPSAITMSLYYVIFGNLIGNRIGKMGDVPYIQYIAPGLVMMAVITNSYSNVVASFFSSKFQRYIDELIISPTPNYIILLGYISGGIARGCTVGFIVVIISIFFTSFKIDSIAITVSVVFLSSLLFSLAGLINGIFARKFDDVSIIPTFVLTPLTYLGGVFYSIALLPPFWEKISQANPIFYMINAFRHGMIGKSDVEIAPAFIIIIVITTVLFISALALLNKGIGVKQ